MRSFELEVGDRYMLTGEACDPGEAADLGIYEVLSIRKTTLAIPDLTKTDLPYGEVRDAMMAGTWTGPTKDMGPSHTYVRVRAENGEESDRVIAPWVPLIKV